MKNPHHILLLLTLLAPLASFVTTWLVSEAKHKAITWITTAWILAGFLSAASLLARLDQNEMPLSLTYDWFRTGDYQFAFELVLTRTSALMLTVVALISLLVHVYSSAYMAGDAGYKRYFSMLGFFTFAMQGIVLSNNLLLLFIFWELVGFSSYMLIGHWTTNPQAGRAASKAFILNRIGDAGFLVGLMILWAIHQTFSLPAILAASEPHAWQTAAGLCLFCGVIGKSAQFPLFTWLPDAMEGPTPVSALIHAATMVAAGVYLLVTVFGIFTPDALLVIAIIGMLTSIAGALAALSQHDIKKVLAYSTMSQLGLMVLAIGMGAVDAAFLHLLTHAFFKACLFLSAGMVIHAVHNALPGHMHFDVQDIRNLGGLKQRMPVTSVFFIISGASLAGVPFFSGFLSKEAILSALFMHTNVLSWLMLVVILIVSFLTVLYTFRLIWLIFFGQARAINTLSIQEPEWPMRITTGTLAVGSLWLLVSWNPFNFKGWVLSSQEPSPHALWITIFSALWVIAALFVSWKIFKTGSLKTNALLRNGFYLDRGYERFSSNFVSVTTRGVSWIERRAIDRSLHGIAYGQVIFAHVVGWIDRVFIDGTVNATARLTGWGGKFTRSFQGGNIQLYVFWAVFAIIIFIIWALK